MNTVNYISSSDSDGSVTSDEDNRLLNNLNISDKLNYDKTSNEVVYRNVTKHSKSDNSVEDHYYFNLNIEVVEKLEKDLEFYEIVSIVFLVYEDSQLECALQNLVISSKNRKENRSLIADWCRVQPKYWRQKLMQALTIINNYYVLKKLGYEKCFVENLFSSKRNYISCIRKSLYQFFESLTVTESTSLIESVNKDLLAKNAVEKTSDILVVDPVHLELYFLFWLSRKYISFYKKNVSFLNLMACVENNKELCSIKFRLKSISRNNIRQKLPRNISKRKLLPVVINSKIIAPDDNLNIGSSNGDCTTKESNAYSDISNTINDKFYEIISPAKIGLCVIVNQENFKNRERNPQFQFLSSERLPDRTGSKVDVDTITNTFEGMNYMVIKYNDLSHKEMLSSLTSSVTQYFIPEVHSSLLIFILTHGYEGFVYGSNSVAVPISNIKNSLLQCKTVIGKPKAIIIQACQGTVPQGVVASDSGEEVKRRITKLQGECDLFVGLASVPGYVAFRHKKEGTWFIQTLCKCIRMFASTMDIVKIFTRVNEQISQKTATDETGNSVGQVSECRSSLRSEWFLIPPKSKSDCCHHKGDHRRANYNQRTAIKSNRAQQ